MTTRAFAGTSSQLPETGHVDGDPQPSVRAVGWPVGSLLIAGVLALAVVMDRAAWAAVSQWREDQSLSMWLGLRLFRQPTPVGLLSSVKVPNPNGIAIIGWLLTSLPGLFAVSLALGCISAIAALSACVNGEGWRKWWPVLIPLLTSIHLRAIGAELWGQWLMIPLNLFFVGTTAAYLRRPRLLHWVAASVLIVSGPAIYLAGLVNACAFLVIWAAVVWWRRRSEGRASELRVSAVIAAIVSVVSVASVVTWVPYMGTVPVGSLVHSIGAPIQKRFAESCAALFLLPAALLELLRGDFSPILQSDCHIVRQAAFSLGYAAGLVAKAQATVALVASLILYRRKRYSVPALKNAALGGALILVAYPLSPLLGGFAWHRGERLDQSIQFLPLLLLVIFALPLAVPSLRLRRMTVCCSILFASCSLPAGWMAIQDHLQYHGSVLSQADVPLVQKLAAVDWIARDWGRRNGSAPVPVAYALIGLWGFLPEYGALTSRWYPEQLSVGRAFDYEFLRVHGLRNSFEGQRARASIRARYVVSYAFQPPPPYVRAGAVEHYFGRLRVSVQAD